MNSCNWEMTKSWIKHQTAESAINENKISMMVTQWGHTHTHFLSLSLIGRLCGWESLWLMALMAPPQHSSKATCLFPPNQCSRWNASRRDCKMSLYVQMKSSNPYPNIRWIWVSALKSTWCIDENYMKYSNQVQQQITWGLCFLFLSFLWW